MDTLWMTLELCWMPQPSDRPNIEDVLQCLEMVAQSWEPPSPKVNGEVDEDVDSDSSDNSSGMSSQPIPSVMFYSLSMIPIYQCTMNFWMPLVGQTSWNLGLLSLLYPMVCPPCYLLVPLSHVFRWY